jgi:hypothetical protein
MNELIWKLGDYRFPCKDLKWMRYEGVDWEALFTEKNFILLVIRNFWKDVVHFVEGSS